MSIESENKLDKTFDGYNLSSNNIDRKINTFYVFGERQNVNKVIDMISREGRYRKIQRSKTNLESSILSSKDLKVSKEKLNDEFIKSPSSSNKFYELKFLKNDELEQHTNNSLNHKNDSKESFL